MGPGQHGWYVETAGPHGGVDSSEVQTFTAVAPNELTTSTPVIAGVATAGQTLVAGPGAWGPDGVRLDYRWYADGTAIPGATGTELVLGPDRVGARITVSVTGTLSGYVSATRVSAPTERVSAGEIVAGTPVISGQPGLGRTLTADPGTWGPEGVQLDYRWYADGAAIPGATGTAVLLGTDQVGTRITVRVTGTMAGYTSVTTPSAPTAPVAAGELAGKDPRITGKPRVGALLRARGDHWRPAPVSVRYQWTVAGTAIRSADSPTLRVRKAYIGKRLRLTVTASKPGYRTVVASSPSTAKVRQR